MRRTIFSIKNLDHVGTGWMAGRDAVAMSACAPSPLTGLYPAPLPAFTVAWLSAALPLPASLWRAERGQIVPRDAVVAEPDLPSAFLERL